MWNLIVKYVSKHSRTHVSTQKVTSYSKYLMILKRMLCELCLSVFLYQREVLKSSYGVLQGVSLYLGEESVSVFS